eukprot:CAMPEP_0119209704 /NCGR_PEP_ID=MMETSP1327-20130426/1672_1 /TAXON_ID=38833 /ORGANISM="Micromonas pusilla, Strain RCC2306" /LENGTH=97 /DNA_ID=CAMNT_0007206591 /DNA_START=583 /DNA_END=873 /DNA_ORIENTATION=-
MKSGFRTLLTTGATIASIKPTTCTGNALSMTWARYAADRRASSLHVSTTSAFSLAQMVGFFGRNFQTHRTRHAAPTAIESHEITTNVAPPAGQARVG